VFGFLNVDKPTGLSSRAVVDAVQRLNVGKVGHAGTLDPLATGVLVVCVGPATRLARFVQAQTKEYVGDFRLGVTSVSEDTERDLIEIENAPDVSRSQIEEALPAFTGPIMQVPPAFSALKVNGKRAYALARQGKPVELKAREIVIHSLELLKFDYPHFQLKIVCSSGTYVRSLGRDIGLAVESAAIMTGLRRTAVGGFRADEAIRPDAFEIGDLENNLKSPADGLAGMVQVKVSNEIANRFFFGDFWKPGSSDLEQVSGVDELAAVDESNGNLVAILKKKSDGVFKPSINFSQYWRAEQERAS
jgi:tRNA pseudouridine55 synthase